MKNPMRLQICPAVRSVCQIEANKENCVPHVGQTQNKENKQNNSSIYQQKTVLKVGKSQKQFFMKLHSQKNE